MEGAVTISQSQDTFQTELLCAVSFLTHFNSYFFVVRKLSGAFWAIRLFKGVGLNWPHAHDVANCWPFDKSRTKPRGKLVSLRT